MPEEVLIDRVYHHNIVNNVVNLAMLHVTPGLVDCTFLMLKGINPPM